MRFVGLLALGAAATLTAVAYADAAGPDTTAAPAPTVTVAPPTTDPTTVAPPTTTVAPPTTTVVPPTTTVAPTTTVEPPTTISRSPETTTTTPPPPAREGFYCGNGFRGYEVRADYIPCDTARQVTDAYAAEYPRWASGVVITVSAAGASWDCRQRFDFDEDYQECVNSARPAQRALLYSEFGFAGAGTGSSGR
ncbi:hypothetical protein [Nocardia blacklockiae]|uniref:hypothetical protein n=1 Tax=Nocardia blacklockiae TaxID=480036 RepID=UPI001894F84F|nr:hypothetical protein [Nocardia blacklockiae]MBF6175029.1 hypothetical protein [Nocardia blacklockiae]